MGLEYIVDYYAQFSVVLSRIHPAIIQRMASELASLRQRQGRLFLIGVGGGAANCSHAVNDFRKLCGIEAYAPTDNVAEITARTNDDGWDRVFVDWLRVSNLSNYDAIMVFSVGGGTEAASHNIARAIEYAKDQSARVLGIVGSDKGATAKSGDIVLVVQAPREYVTPFTESMQAVFWHCLVNHPLLRCS